MGISLHLVWAKGIQKKAVKKALIFFYSVISKFNMVYYFLWTKIPYFCTGQYHYSTHNNFYNNDKIFAHFKARIYSFNSLYFVVELFNAS